MLSSLHHLPPAKGTYCNFCGTWSHPTFIVMHFWDGAHVFYNKSTALFMQWCLEGCAINMQGEGQGASCCIPRQRERPKFRVISLDSKNNNLSFMLWGHWVCVEGMHLRVLSTFEGALRKCIEGALEGTFEGVWGCLKARLKACRGDASENIKGTLECTFEGTSRVHLRARQGSVWGSIEGAFEGALRAHLMARWGYVWGRIEGTFEGAFKGALKGCIWGCWGTHSKVHLRCIWGCQLVGCNQLQPVAACWPTDANWLVVVQLTVGPSGWDWSTGWGSVEAQMG